MFPLIATLFVVAIQSPIDDTKLIMEEWDKHMRGF